MGWRKVGIEGGGGEVGMGRLETGFVGSVGAVEVRSERERAACVRRRRVARGRCRSRAGEVGKDGEESREREERDGEEAGEEVGKEADVWRRLLDGVKERIVMGMRKEIEHVNRDVDEEESDAHGSKRMGGDGGAASDSVANLLRGKPTGGEDLLYSDESVMLSRGSEDESVVEDSFQRWERALEDKLRELVDTGDGAQNVLDDGELEGEDYFTLSDDGDAEVGPKDADGEQVDIATVLEGMESQEIQEEIRSAEGVEDVQRLVSRVYDRILQRHKRNEGLDAYDSFRPEAKNDAAQDEERGGGNGTATNPIYEKIRHLSPGDATHIAHLGQQISPVAQKAMGKSLLAILGGLPDHLFELTIQTDRDGLGQVLYTAEVTGYFLRDGEIKLGKRQVVSEEPDEEPTSVGEGLPTPGTQVNKDVSGKLSWWDPTRNERTELHLSTYIQRLEAELDALREQCEAVTTNGVADQSGKLLEYASFIRGGSFVANMKDLSSDAAEALTRTVSELLGRPDPRIRQSFTTGREYLSQLIHWSLMVGYHVRDIESRIELEKLLDES